MRSLFRKIREANRPFCTALVAAAGSSSRMGGTDKLMEFLDNVPVLMRTLTALLRSGVPVTAPSSATVLMVSFTGTAGAAAPHLAAASTVRSMSAGVTSGRAPSCTASSLASGEASNAASSTE